MFSGIIESVGKVVTIENRGGDKRLTFDTGNMDIHDVKTGESIAVNGVCLTVTSHTGNRFCADISAETISCTTFDDLKNESRVNLERSLKLSDRLHGHMVSGHVDGVATVRERKTDANSEKIVLECPAGLMKYICRKGSVSVDGVSLTVNEKLKDAFTVNIIPHTLQETIISGYRKGTRVNIEIDLVARYLESLMTSA